METKFKKGDRVVAVKDCPLNLFNTGQKGVVDKVINDYTVFVQWEGGVGSHAYTGTCGSEVKVISPDLTILQLQNQRLLSALKSVRDAIAKDPMYINTHRAICDVIKEENGHE